MRKMFLPVMQKLFMKKKMFNPKTIAVIGAIERENSVGRGVIENLNKGDADIFFVNPNIEMVFGEKTYSKITDIDSEIDLAIIIIPKQFVSQAVDDCIEKMVGGVIIISSGFAEIDEEGRIIQEEISKKLKEANIDLVGPNTLGIIRPPISLNASFAPGNPKKGEIAFIFQSGGLIDAVIDGSEKENYGFSLIVSVGNAAGVSIADYIKFADDDIHTKVIALYIEGVKNGRYFLETLKKVKKPVIIIKAGRIEKTKKTISSHTGSLAGEYNIFSGVLKQAGAMEVDSLEELFDVAKALAWLPAGGRNIGVVTNGGGVGVLLTDYLYENNFLLPEIEKETVDIINSNGPVNFSLNNPMDVLGDALSDRYEKACRGIIQQDNISSLVVVQTPQIMTEHLENAKKIVRLREEFKKPILTSFMGAGEKTREAINYLEENKIPNYSDPKRLIKPLLSLINNN